MAAVALEHADRVYLTLDNPRTEDPERIFADTRRGFAAAPDRALTIPDRAEAIERALQDCRSEDVLLIAGKGHERYQIIGTERVEWDDREVARRTWAQPREGRA